jgi:hypothetical protein
VDTPDILVAEWLELAAQQTGRRCIRFFLLAPRGTMSPGSARPAHLNGLCRA